MKATSKSDVNLGEHARQPDKLARSPAGLIARQHDSWPRPWKLGRVYSAHPDAQVESLPGFRARFFIPPAPTLLFVHKFGLPLF